MSKLGSFDDFEIVLPKMVNVAQCVCMCKEHFVIVGQFKFWCLLEIVYFTYNRVAG